jgi:hypothetical protein
MFVVVTAMERMPEDLSLRILEILDRSLEALGNRFGGVDTATLLILLALACARFRFDAIHERYGFIVWDLLMGSAALQ